jgi:hypothetical protein
LRTLPTLWSSRPRALVHVPIRVDRCWSNKTGLLPGTLMVPPTIIPLPGHVLGGPCVPPDTCHRRGQTKMSQTGTHARITWAHKVIAAYLIRVAHMHNLPSLVVPIRGKTIDQVKAVPYRQMWLHLESSFQWHYDSIQPMEEVVIIKSHSSLWQ